MCKYNVIYGSHPGDAAALSLDATSAQLHSTTSHALSGTAADPRSRRPLRIWSFYRISNLP